MSKIVCLDAHAIIWGIKKQASDSQKDMIPITISFLEWLDKEGYDTIIPAPVLTEVLVKSIPKTNEHKEILRKIWRRFRIAPFDANAANICAEIWAKNGNSQEIKKYREDKNISRVQFKYDIQIVAIACVNGCECIYSNDIDIAKFANNYIDVREIPDKRDSQLLLDFE